MPSYKLYYFPVRGVGETARQLFVISKTPFEDIRLEREEFQAKYKTKMPFGQMPVLEEDGKQLAQSNAIARYLARKFGFAGKTAWEEAQVDALADQWKDFVAEVRPYFLISYGLSDGDLQKTKTDVFIPGVKKHLPFYVAALKKAGSGYLVGKSLTYIDLIVAEYVANLDKDEPELVGDFPTLRDHYKKIHSNPELKKWRETRPETKF